MRCHFASILLFLLLLAGPPVSAATDDLSLQTIEARKSALGDDPALDESVRRAAMQAYDEAEDLLRRATDAEVRTHEYLRLANDGPAALAEILAELAKTSQPARPVVPEDATLAQLEQFLARAMGDVDAAQRRIDELAAEAQHRTARNAVIPQHIAALRKELEELGPITGAPPNDEPGRARLLAGHAKRLLIARDIERLEAENLAYDADRAVLPARRDLAQRRLGEANRIASQWQEIVSDRRQEEADLARNRARVLSQEAADEHPLLAAIAADIAELTEERSKQNGVTARIDRAERKLKEVRADIRNLLENARTVERRLSVSGVNEATGLLLIRSSRSLPYPATLRRSVRDLKATIAQAEFRLIVLEDERAAAGDIDALHEALLEEASAGEVMPAARRERIAATAIELLTVRRNTLDQALSDQRRLLERLIELETAEETLLRISTAFSDFIAERLFWVRSVSGPLLPARSVVSDAGRWILDADAWQRTAAGVLHVTRDSPLQVALAILLIAALFVLRRKCNRQLSVLAELVARQRTDAFRHTLAALALTLIGALPLPAVLMAAAWLLSRPPDMPESTVAIAVALRITATLLIPYIILVRLLRPDGLASAHFRWEASAVRHVRLNLSWFIPSIIPLAFVLLVMIEQSADERWNASIGRLAFIATMLLLALFWQRILHTNRPVAGAIFGSADVWAHKVRAFWHVLLVITPLATAIIAGLGYYATALSVQAMIVSSIWLLLGAFVVHAMLMRWLFIARRRLAIEHARRERALAASAEAGAHLSENASTDDVPRVAAAEESRIDVPSLNIRTRTLINTLTAIILVVGLYGIWSDILPALRMLDRLQLWPRMTLLEATESPATRTFSAVIASGGAHAEWGEVAADAQTSLRDPLQRGESEQSAAADDSAAAMPLMPVPSAGEPRDTARDGGLRGRQLTVADLGAAFIILGATLIAIRNVPGLVEIIVLQRLPLDAGTRNAVSTIVRYVITIVGITIGLGALGITWSSVQWLAAALTFGLAFGLQEIFANFISGLIILVERPIRVGDVVTTNNISGTVSKIQMRATTIVDFDRKELIIPNKMFITDQVINWTLSDPTLRLVITVGVSYGADIDAAERALLEVARSMPSVMNDPAPSVVFQRFGDSTLDFDLRVFLPHINELFPTRHAINRAILERFRQEGIEIAFPQRDLHIRSAEGLGATISQAINDRQVVEAGSPRAAADGDARS